MYNSKLETFGFCTVFICTVSVMFLSLAQMAG